MGKDDTAKLGSFGVAAGAAMTLLTLPFPAPTKHDSAKIWSLLEADDMEGLKAAAREGYYLNDHDGMYTTFHTAAMNGQLEIMEMLVYAGASPFSITSVH